MSLSVSAVALLALVATPATSAVPVSAAIADDAGSTDPALFFSAGPCDENFCEKCIVYTIAACAAQGSVAAYWDCSIQQSNNTVTGCTCRGSCEFGVMAARVGGIL